MKNLSLIISLVLFISTYASAVCDPNIPGDINKDCHVDFSDFAELSADWLKISDVGAEAEWVARYSGPGISGDGASAIAIDSNDNIYITGGSYGLGTDDDYTTIKYSADSNQPVWTARYDGPGNYYDRASAIAIDSNDNIYVTGYSSGDGTYSDYATIKYSPDSNQPVWVARYDGPDNYYDSAEAIAINSNDNIYVTGTSYGLGTSNDYATIKYSADSNQPVWIARYDGPANSMDWPLAIAIDSNDNIYVTGYSSGSGTDSDYATIKYAPDSNQPVWVARYNGPGNGGDYALAIAIDSNDNIYVTGGSYGLGTWDDYATIKYTPDSNQPVWVARYNGLGNGSDWPSAIAIDSNDNIYVTGGGLGTDYDYATIKYAPDSNQPVWVARYNGPDNGSDYALDIAIDSNDIIYVTGWSVGLGTSDDYTTVKYSPDSNEPVWVARYNGPDSSGDLASAIAIDSNDNVYVTGESDGDYATIKYSNGCATELSGDLNDDCVVDLKDLYIFCLRWLDCNLEPPELCWQ